MASPATPLAPNTAHPLTLDVFFHPSTCETWKPADLRQPGPEEASGPLSCLPPHAASDPLLGELRLGSGRQPARSQGCVVQLKAPWRAACEAQFCVRRPGELGQWLMEIDVSVPRLSAELRLFLDYSRQVPSRPWLVICMAAHLLARPCVVHVQVSLTRSYSQARLGSFFRLHSFRPVPRPALALPAPGSASFLRMAASGLRMFWAAGAAAHTPSHSRQSALP